MNMLKRSLRATVAFAAGAAMLVAVSPSAMAVDPTVKVNTDHPANACTITYASLSFSLSVSATWNTTTLAWNPINAQPGTMSALLKSTGTPGDRFCTVSASNSNFLNGSVSFLDKDALKFDGQPLSSSAPHTFDVPQAVGGILLTSTVSVVGSPTPTAPAGTYTSTITYTVAPASSILG